jgi:hypothetical protein
MQATALVVVVAVGGFGCFSTARYDDAHVQRVASINARYEAETLDEQQREVELAAVLEEHRALLVPIKPGSRSAPVRRVAEREDIVECRKQCERLGDESLEASSKGQVEAQCVHEICEPAYVDALTKTYVNADSHWVASQLAVSEDAELESLLAFSHNQAVSRRIEDETRGLAQLQAQHRQHLERDRQAEIAVSARLRDSEIASGRAAHRARIQAAAFAARDGGPISAGESSLCTAGDPRLRHVAGCTPEQPLPDRAMASSREQASIGER